MKNEAIKKAIKIAGGQQKLATLCGVSQPTVWRWLHGGGIDAKFVMLITCATNNQVTPAEIRPDLTDLMKANTPLSNQAYTAQQSDVTTTQPESE